MKLIINEYKAQVILGVYAEEKLKKCDILINMEIEYTPQKAISNDDVNATIDYDNLVLFIDKFLINKNYNLIERLIDDLGHELIDNFMLIDRMKLVVTKLGIIPKAREVKIESCYIRG
jgi:FolB domain-containing protein